jgi:hypothetical protein
MTRASERAARARQKDGERAAALVETIRTGLERGGGVLVTAMTLGRYVHLVGKSHYGRAESYSGFALSDYYAETDGSRSIASATDIVSRLLGKTRVRRRTAAPP